MSDAIVSAKRALRADLRERRQQQSDAARQAAADGIREQLNALVDRFQATSISCFLSTPFEPGTREFVRDALDRGIRVLLPITRADGLLDWAVATPDGEVTVGVLGIDEPTGQLLGPIAVGEVDLMIIPAASIDETGMRLGWGRGYFDKTIGSMERHPPIYAVVYDAEFVAEVPSDDNDERVNGVVTPTRTVTFTDTTSTDSPTP